MYITNYRLQNVWLDKCLKSLVSEDHSRNNMVNGPKHCCNLKASNFTRTIDGYESN